MTQSALVPDGDLLWRPAQALQPLQVEGPRVLILGDRELSGEGRPIAETLEGQLSERLAAAATPAQLINGAVPGYSLLQTQAWLDQEGWALEPDLLVLGPGISDCAPSQTTDAALMSCLSAPTKQLQWAWQPPEAAATLPQLADGQAPSLEALGCEAAPTPHRVPPSDYAQALDRLLLDAAKREVGVVILVSDDPALESCPHRQLTHRVSTRRAVPVLEMEEVNRSAGAWGRGARADDGQPSVRALAAASQAVTDLLRQVGWPARPLRPEIAAPPYQGAGER